MVGDPTTPRNPNTLTPAQTHHHNPIPLASHHPHPHKRWIRAEWSIPQKRAIIAALIDTLIVKPTEPGKRGARFRPERVELTFKA